MLSSGSCIHFTVLSKLEMMPYWRWVKILTVVVFYRPVLTQITANDIPSCAVSIRTTFGPFHYIYTLIEIRSAAFTHYHHWTQARHLAAKRQVSKRHSRHVFIKNAQCQMH
jgi:hypothetical protein